MELEEWLEIDTYEKMPTGEGPIAISRHVPPKEKLAIRLFGTDFEVGELTLRLLDSDADPEPGVAKFVNYPLTLVSHPTRGVLNVGLVTGCPDIDQRRRLEHVHHQLRMTTEILSEELREHQSTGEPHDYWTNRDLPFGPALFRLGDATAIDPISLDVAPEICLDTTWPALPDKITSLMDHHHPGTGEDYLPRHLATALKTFGDSYIDHVDYVAKWQFVTAQLFESDRTDRAA